MVMRRGLKAPHVLAVDLMFSFEGKVVVEYHDLLLLALFSHEVFAYFDSQRSDLYVKGRIIVKHIK